MCPSPKISDPKVREPAKTPVTATPSGADSKKGRMGTILTQDKAEEISPTAKKTVLGQ